MHGTMKGAQKELVGSNKYKNKLKISPRNRRFELLVNEVNGSIQKQGTKDDSD